MVGPEAGGGEDVVENVGLWRGGRGGGRGGGVGKVDGEVSETVIFGVGGIGVGCPAVGVGG